MTTTLEARPSVIQNPEIEELRQPVQNLLRQLAPNINTGAYAVILGEDASGRIPTLIFRKVIGEIYQRLGLSQPYPETHFFASYCPPAQEVSSQFKTYLERGNIPQKAQGKRVLIVTEQITSGDHMKPYLQCLRDSKVGIYRDVATTGASRSSYFSKDGKFKDLLQATIFSGRRSLLPGIYDNHLLAGVEKNTSPPTLFAHLLPVPERLQARQDVEITAGKLVSWYFQQGLNRAPAAI